MARKIVYSYSEDPHPELFSRKDISAQIESINDKIANNDLCEDLQQLLLTPHIETELKKGDKLLCQYFSRPLIEAIYIQAPASFDSILERLSEKWFGPAADAFMNAWNQTIKEKGNDLPSQLFVWNDKAARKARAQLDVMASYGEKLLKQDPTAKVQACKKGNTINELCEGKEGVEGIEAIKGIKWDIDNFIPTMNVFRTAKFKRALVKKLHQHDSDLNEHRDSPWKHNLVNVIAFLFTGGLAHLVNGGINYFTTGSATFSFFSRTDSQKHVDRVHHTLDSSIRMNLKI